MADTAPMPTDLLTMSGISRRFPGVLALQGVSLRLAAGEVLALLGENGAGKSTLMKILGGALRPDAGAVSIDGAPVEFASPTDAKRRGIAMIHQELMLCENLDVAANIGMGLEPGGRLLWRPLQRRALVRRAQGLLKRVGLKVDPTTPVSALTAGQRQLVEIAKALALNARIIVMDEPTSSLSSSESAQLFAIIHQLRPAGLGVIYISHRLEEVFALADRIVVLRDGQNVGEMTRAEATHQQVVTLMVGRALTQRQYPDRSARAAPARPPLLEVKDLQVPGSTARASFELRAGEILGFAGLVGAGRTELMQTVFGHTRARGGTMRLNGADYAPSSAHEAIECGVVLVPEDRKRHGLVLGLSPSKNITLAGLRRWSRAGRLDAAAEERVASAQIRRLRIKIGDRSLASAALSGGNQQKVVLGKWLALNPRVMILDEPTRGIDVGARAEIYQHIAELAASGVGILMVSSDLEEIMGLCDRVVIMHERRVRGILERDEINAERIAMLMTGGPSGLGLAA